MSDKSSLAVGLSNYDIEPNVYEGGFKTWECAIDLAEFLSRRLSTEWELEGREVHVVEVLYVLPEPSAQPNTYLIILPQVGAGTALPSLVFFDFFLKHRSPSWRAIRLSVADYNLSVLENATIPNLLLTWYFAQPTALLEAAGDLDITPDLLSRFLRDMSDKAICISGISGSWNEAFSDILVPFEDSQNPSRIETIFLASETIYSLDSIQAFTEVLLKALELAEETYGSGKALVAAKKLYFGVGGGVDEFLKVLNELGGKGETVWESKDKGVAKVIMEVKRASKKAADW